MQNYLFINIDCVIIHCNRMQNEVLSSFDVILRVFN